MPFGLKHAGAIPQRMVKKFFNAQIGKNLEFYINNMITKSRQAGYHALDRRETFMTNHDHQVRLNPNKCVFALIIGKCPRSLVDEREIEVHPDKI